MTDAWQSLDGAEELEDDGVLSVADSLTSDRLEEDELDVGVDAGTRYHGATSFGTTFAEQLQGEPLGMRLGEEDPDLSPDAPWTDEEDPNDDDNVPLARAGRLLAVEGSPSQDVAVARDVGIDGGAAAAEEAAVHLTVPPRFR